MRRLGAPIAVVLTLLTASASGQLQVTFQALPVVPVGGPATSIAAGDFNADGRLDLAVAKGPADEVLILTGDGTGQFSASAAIPLVNPFEIAVGNLDGDQLPDIVVVDSIGPPQQNSYVSVLRADGAGGFAATVEYLVGVHGSSIAIGDRNNDTLPDLIVSGSYSNDVISLLGDGQGGFPGWAFFATPSDPVSVALGDFNGDFQSDLAVACSTANNVTIQMSGSTNPKTVGTGIGPRCVAVGDLNGDGKQDLAITYNNSVTTRFGNGLGGFVNVGVAQTFGVGSTAEQVSIADLNADGHEDLVVAAYLSNTLSILLGDGTGDFPVTSVIPVGTGPRHFALGDFNGDATLDIAVANDDSHDVSILLNQSTWGVVGYGLPGVNGIPLLVGSGTLEAGSSGSLTLAKAAPAALAVLFGSISSAPVPFKGGRLVPVPPVVVLALTTSAGGAITVPWAAWPAGVPAGLDLYFQYAIADAAAVQHVSLSNAVMGNVP